MGSPETVRAFIAIELPDDLRGRLAGLVALLRPKLGRASCVKPENIHVTLRFLGDSSAEQLEQLREGLTSTLAMLPKFECRCEGLGVFPNPKAARVLWVGLSPEGPLQSLNAAAEYGARAAGYPREKQQFHPHATLARLRESPPANELRDALAEFQSFDGGTFRVEHVKLMRSELTPNGSIYTPLQNFSLRD